MTKGILPLAVMEKLIKNAGNIRVSADAKDALREVLEEKAIEISQKSLSYAKHSGRTTIKEEDIKLATK